MWQSRSDNSSFTFSTMMRGNALGEREPCVIIISSVAARVGPRAQGGRARMCESIRIGERVRRF